MKAFWESRLAASSLSVLMTVAMKRSEEHTSKLQSRLHLVCRLLLEKKKKRGHLKISVKFLHLKFYYHVTEDDFFINVNESSFTRDVTSAIVTATDSTTSIA